MNLSMMSKKGFVAFLCAASLLSCTEEIDSSMRYVFKENTAASYLEKHDQYSEYVKLLRIVPVSDLSETTVLQLLSARGNYTVFAPTNEAIQDYLDTLVTQDVIPQASWEAFPDSTTLDSIRKVIVMNSIIDGGDDVRFCVGDFPVKSGTDITLPNMYDRKVTVTYPDSSVEVVLVNDCPIDVRNRDIPVLNGFIHMVSRVIAPSNDNMARLMEEILRRQEKGHYVASLLARACGMLDTLRVVRDDTYEMLYQNGKIRDHSNVNGPKYAPKHRYCGFTYFAETDDFWSNVLGKNYTDITVEDVVNYLVENDIYPDAVRDDNYRDENNILNRFVTYHFLPFILQPGTLVYHRNEMGFRPIDGTRSVVMAEFFTTMGKRRLLKLLESRESDGVYLNSFPKIDNGRRGTYHETGCDPDKRGILVGTPNREGRYNIRNGIIYPIDKLLVYDDATRSNMAKGRIRWDAAAMFPEMMTNDIRLNPLDGARYNDYAFPADEVYRYFEGAWNGRSQELGYRTGGGAFSGFNDYLGDEFQLHGIPDMTMRMPPVPVRGTYELRYGIQATDSRSMVQCYWGTDPGTLHAEGLPLDTRIGGKIRYTSNGTYPSDIGWEQDTDDDEYNAEIDKRMRNKGYMKNVALMATSTGGGTSQRTGDNTIRRIILRMTLDPDETYYLKFKGVLDDQNKFLFFDFMEYCPKEVYDNPEEPEDIW